MLRNQECSFLFPFTPAPQDCCLIQMPQRARGQGGRQGCGQRWWLVLGMPALALFQAMHDPAPYLSQAFLYKFYGFSLWTARNEQVIKMMLSALLQTSHEELQEREVRQSVLAKGEPFQFERQAGWQGGQKPEPGKADHLGWNNSPVTYQPCALEQLIEPLCASVSSSIRWGYSLQDIS